MNTEITLVMGCFLWVLNYFLFIKDDKWFEIVYDSKLENLNKGVLKYVSGILIFLYIIMSIWFVVYLLNNKSNN